MAAPGNDPLGALLAIAFGLAFMAALWFWWRHHEPSRRLAHRQPHDEHAMPFTQLGPDHDETPLPPWTPRTIEAAPLVVPDIGAVRETLALANVDRAIAVLRRHVENESRSMPTAWLILFHLYRTHGRDQAFADLTRDFQARFHAQAAELAARGDGLEAYPPIVKLLATLWGTHECRALLDRLEGDRATALGAALSPAARVELAKLRDMLDGLLAEFDADNDEESKLRAAWATARAQASVTS